ncbi:MAG: DUF5615 family PIN-like protein [Cyanobacteria bacterium J06626_6]
MVKFLLDQDVYRVTVKFLLSASFDVVSVSQLGLSRAPDTEVLSTAQSQGRILITRDRDLWQLSLRAVVGFWRDLSADTAVECSRRPCWVKPVSKIAYLCSNTQCLICEEKLNLTIMPLPIG